MKNKGDLRSRKKAKDFVPHDYQKSATHDVNLCVAAPIFNHNNTIKAIWCIDSKDKIELTENDIKNLREHVLYHCSFIDKHVQL